MRAVYDVEADERYQRTDLAAVHAFHARKAFVDCISDGEANIDLAEAALAIAAEDDALGTLLNLYRDSRGPIQLFPWPPPHRVPRI